MSVALKTPLPRPAADSPSLHRFTVAQYHQMIERGILTGDDRVELLEGRIVDKMPHNPPHDGSITRVYRRIDRVLPDDWLLRIQSAVTLRDSEPEPDFGVVRGPEEEYFSRHPNPRDIGLLIEVADSTLMQDRRYKGQLYAQNRIPAYWIINLVNRIVEVHTSPRGGKSPSYRERHDYQIGKSVPLILEGRQIGLIPVRELLP